jgi:hypothetical protein
MRCQQEIEVDHSDMAPRLDVVWVTVEEIPVQDLCCQVQALDLDVTLAGEEDSVLAEDADGAEAGSVDSGDIPIPIGCPTGVLMMCPLQAQTFHKCPPKKSLST